MAVTSNADLKVGALEETITVSGQTPLVDVTQATRTQVLTQAATTVLAQANQSPQLALQLLKG